MATSGVASVSGSGGISGRRTSLTGAPDAIAARASARCGCPLIARSSSASRVPSVSSVMIGGVLLFSSVCSIIHVFFVDIAKLSAGRTALLSFFVGCGRNVWIRRTLTAPEPLIFKSTLCCMATWPCFLPELLLPDGRSASTFFRKFGA